MYYLKYAVFQNLYFPPIRYYAFFSEGVLPEIFNIPLSQNLLPRNMENMQLFQKVYCRDIVSVFRFSRRYITYTSFPGVFSEIWPIFSFSRECVVQGYGPYFAFPESVISRHISTIRQCHYVYYAEMWVICTLSLSFIVQWYEQYADFFRNVYCLEI